MHHTEGNLLELNSLLSRKALNYDSDHFSEVSSSTQICDFPAFILIAQNDIFPSAPPKCHQQGIGL
jgi:hypothetical protein